MQDKTTSGLVWEEPPTGGRSRSNWRSVGTELRSRPGAWAVVGTFDLTDRSVASTLASSIKGGRLGGFARGEFDAIARIIDDQVKVYACFVGGDPR